MSKVVTNTPSFSVTHRVGQMSSANAISDSYGADATTAHYGGRTQSYVWDAAADRRAAPIYIYRDIIKRAIDILFIVLTLPFSLPIILFCAIALWLEGGNPFYTQDRLGLGGKRFSILKLRTMVCNADALLESHLASNPDARAEWDTIQKLKNDPRITPIGKILRSTSLDELPQLFNVFVGEMSIVGPRPMLPEQLPMYGNAAAYNALRPGITGLWQVSARNEEKFSYRNEVDTVYEDGLSLQLDLKILFKTVGVVLRRTGH